MVPQYGRAIPSTQKDIQVGMIIKLEESFCGKLLKHFFKHLSAVFLLGSIVILMKE